MLMHSNSTQAAVPETVRHSDLASLAAETRPSAVSVVSLNENARTENWIRNAMSRNGVEAPEAVRIGICGRKATLTGTVASWSQLRTIVQAARSAPGIRVIDDQLRIHRG